MKTPVIHVFPTLSALVNELLQWLTQGVHDDVRDHGHAAWALSGGRTPSPLYQALNQLGSTFPWDATSLYLVDERDVWPTDPLSNYHMIADALLMNLQTPPESVYSWHTMLEPRYALASYRQALARLPRLNTYPCLDTAIQGMGADGHTASVFPQTPQLLSQDWVAYGPGPQAFRYTLTLPLLANARRIVFMVSGTDKAAAVKECLTNTSSPLPAAWLSQHGGEVHWFLDTASAAHL